MCFFLLLFQEWNCWVRRCELPSFERHSEHHISWWKRHHKSASNIFQVFSPTHMVRLVQKSHQRSSCRIPAFIFDNAESVVQSFHKISNGSNWQSARADLGVFHLAPILLHWFFFLKLKVFSIFLAVDKGQLISKAIYGLLKVS